MSAGFLRLVGAVAGSRTSGRAGLSWVSVVFASPVARRRRAAVSQECRVKALLGAEAEGRGR